MYENQKDIPSHGFTSFDFPILNSESIPGMSKGDFVVLLFISKHLLHWTNSKIGIIIDEKVILELPDRHMTW
jgi:hypothetical protein